MSAGGGSGEAGGSRPGQPAGKPGDPGTSERWRLAPGERTIDPRTWAGGIAPSTGVAPRLRLPRGRWFNLLWLLPLGLALLVAGVALAKGLRTEPAVAHFIRQYSGTTTANPSGGARGFPAWLRWQHFFNALFLVFIIRAGWQILADHPRLYWTRHSTPGREWLRFQKPVPDDPLWTAKQDSVSLPRHLGLPGLRHSIGLARWWHLSFDVLWVLNGAVFYGLLFASGQWQRLVPGGWQVFPEAGSALLQYLSLQWPANHGWVAYNGLQLLAYFVTVFVAAPLAVLTGLGMSPALSTRFRLVSSPLSIQVARSVHFLVMAWFVAFTVIHLGLVFTTGILTNLNHIYLGTNSGTWVGFWVFGASLAVVIATWVAASPFTIRHPRVVQAVGQRLLGPLERAFEHLDPRAGQYAEKDISPYFWHNGKYPDSKEYRQLQEGGFSAYRLRIGGLVAHPQELGLEEIRALPHHEQITQHFCIQGWSGVARWGGVAMSAIVDLVQPAPEARWVAFYSLAAGPDGGAYYDAHPIGHMGHHLTMLAYDMNGEPLSFGHGAPLRLRNELELGFKQVKWIRAIEFVRDFSELGGGRGGYNEDHEFFGYRQAI
ncbi:MAG: molybdopterin-dependent oxidoreductase [Candidatus Dormibacteria bacterium]